MTARLVMAAKAFTVIVREQDQAGVRGVLERYRDGPRNGQADGSRRGSGRPGRRARTRPVEGRINRVTTLCRDADDIPVWGQSAGRLAKPNFLRTVVDQPLKMLRQTAVDSARIFNVKREQHPITLQSRSFSISLILSHFLRRTGIHFVGQYSRTIVRANTVRLQPLQQVVALPLLDPHAGGPGRGRMVG
ncbi:hypothetical protein ACQVP2_26080 [Methylobacterium aquaticum]|uniref:hypothetical protein n=1 Tax=Methylobacterium aquaticum TaxID=270351 RepID=UPI003D165D4A